MLLPFAFAFIVVFAVIALWLIIRKAKGKTEKRDNLNKGPQGPNI